MIEYVEIRNTKREVIGIIDTAQSVIWKTLYYGVGDFEVYAQATARNVELLAVGNYVTRLDNDEVGIIERIEVTFDILKGRMISATGRFAKSLLERRIIYALSGTQNKATILRGNVETSVRNLVSANMITSSDAKRNISILSLGAAKNLPAVIVDKDGKATQKQVSCDNLLTYSDSLLKEYKYGAKITLSSADDLKLQYNVFSGVNRSIDNTDGNEPIIFSQDYDNLIESEYALDTKTEKNVALIGGSGEDLDRFYSLLAEKSGLDRREIFVDAKSINRKYKNDGDTEEKTYSVAEYRKMLNAKGKQDLSAKVRTETFNGKVNLSQGQWVLNRDFFLGDVVTIQDVVLGRYINSRIIEITEAQDEKGYSVEAKFEN